MTELLPKPKYEDFRYPASYPRNHYGDADERAYERAWTAYYKRLAEFAIEALEKIVYTAPASPHCVIAAKALSTIKGSQS